MNPSSVTPEIIQVVVGLVVSAAVTTLGILIRKAFADFTDQLKSLGAKVDAMATTVNNQHTEISVMRQRIESLERWRDRTEK